MHAAGAEVPVHHPGQSVPGEQVAELGEVVGQPLRRHRRVLPAGPRLDGLPGGGVGEPRTESGAVLPHPPQVGAGDGVCHYERPGRVAVRRELVGQGGDPVVEGGGCVVVVKFYEQPRAPRGEVGDGVGTAALPHRLDDHLVHTLYGCRTVRQDGRHVPGGVHHVGVAHHEQSGARGAGDDPHARGGDDRARALRPDERPCHVESLVGQQVSQMVAGHLARDPAQFGADRDEVFRGQVPQFGGEVFGARGGGGVVRVGRLDAVAGGGQAQAVRGDELERLDVVGGPAVAHRMVAAGVVADRPADAGARLAGGVGGEGQAMIGGGMDGGAKVGEHHAGLGGRGGGGAGAFAGAGDGARTVGVHRQYPVHVPRQVQHQAVADRVARHRRAAAPRGRGNAEAVAHGQRGGDLVLGAREQHRRGHDTIVGGVVGVLGDAAGVGLGLETCGGERLDQGGALRAGSRARVGAPAGPHRRGHDPPTTFFTARVKRSTP